MVLITFVRQMAQRRPESGLDFFIYVEIARQRTHGRTRTTTLDSWARRY